MLGQCSYEVSKVYGYAPNLILLNNFTFIAFTALYRQINQTFIAQVNKYKLQQLI